VLLHLAHVRLRQPFLSFTDTTSPSPPSSSFSKSASPFPPSRSFYKAVVFAQCVYSTPFPTFHKEVIFLGLAEQLEACNCVCDRVGERAWRRSSSSMGSLERATYMRD
jgi:hypothetical protein